MHVCRLLFTPSRVFSRLPFSASREVIRVAHFIRSTGYNRRDSFWQCPSVSDGNNIWAL